MQIPGFRIKQTVKFAFLLLRGIPSGRKLQILECIHDCASFLARQQESDRRIGKGVCFSVTGFAKRPTGKNADGHRAFSFTPCPRAKKIE